MPITNPTDISNLQQWLQARDLTTLFQNVAGTTPVTTSGEVVGTWNDKSGTSFNMTAQADDTTRPTFTESAGVQWVDGDGTNDLLVRAAAPFFAAGAASFFFAMRASATNASGDSVLSECNSGDNAPLYLPLRAFSTVTDAAGFIRNGANTELINSVLDATNVFDGADHVIGVVDTGSLLTLWFDGVEKTGVAYTRSGTLTANRFSLFGVARGTPNLWFATRIYESACYTKALDDTEAGDLSTYLTGAFVAAATASKSTTMMMGV